MGMAKPSPYPWGSEDSKASDLLQVGLLTAFTSMSVYKRLPLTSVCRNWQLQLPTPWCLHPETSGLQRPPTEVSYLSPPFPVTHNKHSEGLGGGIVGAAPSEHAQPTWLQLFYSCVCVPALCSFSHFPRQIARTKPHWMWQGCATAHQFWTSETSKLPHDLCIYCFKLLKVYSFSL